MSMNGSNELPTQPKDSPSPAETIRVWVVEAVGVGVCYFKDKKEALEEVKLHMDEMFIPHVVIWIEDMSVEDYQELTEFEGY